MKFKQVYPDPKTFVFVFANGDEVTEPMLRFAREQHLGSASISAIGAFDHCVLGYFDWDTKKYLEIPIQEQVEVLSLIGNLSWDGDQPKLHAHVVIGLRDGSARGGHLLKGIVRPTLEITLIESPAHLQRRYDSESHLPLIRLDAE